MNAGLSNLATLKSWLLPPAMAVASNTTYDDQIAAIGLGVAGLLEKHCARKFQRTVGDTYEAAAERTHFVLPRYPVEAITAIHMRDAGSATWTSLGTTIIDQTYDAAGLVELDGAQGTWRERIRFTYTGGYFWETLEPAAQGYPTAVPAGSTAVPSDLLLAWRLQCEHVWAQRDKLGTGLAQINRSGTPLLGQVELIPTVRDLARTFIRHELL